MNAARLNSKLETPHDPAAPSVPGTLSVIGTLGRLGYVGQIASPRRFRAGRRAWPDRPHNLTPSTAPRTTRSAIDP